MACRVVWPVFALVLAACSDDVEESAPPAPPPGPAEWNREVTPPDDAEADQKRLSCSYQAGSLPAETQGASHPNGAEIPIDHVLIVMMENRSFDHYYQKLPEFGQPDVDVAPATFTNPDPDGMPVGIFHETNYCFVDTAHGWNASHAQVNGGAMDGFVVTNEGNHELPVHGTLEMLSGTRAMGYYDETDLPFYYWLANEFAIADRNFASVLGPTWPNRMYLFAASSFGIDSNDIAPPQTTLIDYLDMRQVDWKLYHTTTATYGIFAAKFAEQVKTGRIVTIDQYFADAAAGTLPQVAFVEPGVGFESYQANDEHPPAIMQVGQRWAADVITALAKSPNWPRSALFLTYDEHGGLYDHVVPPEACPPDLQSSQFNTYGIRVPLLVVSPYAKRHHVSHRIYDHTSIVRFVEARFVMPALTHRDANAEAPWDMFDFANPTMEPPAFALPEPNPTKLADCQAIFEP